MKPFILVGAMMLAMAPAAAQMSNQPDKQKPPASPCQADPDRDGNAVNDEQAPPSGNLTKKLGPCNGVLKPPPTGDSGLAAPAPDQGNTPVIKPGQLPPQQPTK